MNRRSFLQFIGIAPFAGGVSPLLAKAPEVECFGGLDLSRVSIPASECRLLVTRSFSPEEVCHQWSGTGMLPYVQAAVSRSPTNVSRGEEVGS